jgi:ribulose 1,5-bisphosphate synthetase/thiazole synthase
MSEFILNRRIPIEDSYDVVVAGGGPAGAAAAVSAARLGAKTLLIEATGCLGGMGTSGLVTAFDPMANGEENLVGGFMLEVVEELYERGFLGVGVTPEWWRKKYLTWTPFNVEGYKLVLDEKMTKAGVEVRFFTRVIDADVRAEERSVNGLVLNNVEGYSFIAAKSFIDCTGDAVLANLCGAACWEAGRDTPRIMPATLPSLFAGVDFQKYKEYVKKEGHEQFNGIVRKGIADGVFIQPDPFLVGISQVGPTVAYLNGGHLFNLNALRCQDLSRNVMLGRRIAQDYLAFYRKYIPGCEKMEHVTTASLLGIRESRRIQGEYVLSVDDYLARREFPDQIGIFNKFVDIHPYDTSEEEYQRFTADHEHRLRLNQGEYFGIPYGILVPKGWQNLWVAGRCVSSDVRVHGSIRVQPACSMMGQAAGTAAVQSIRRKQPACSLDTEELVTTLRELGAKLPQKNLNPAMTRGGA